MLESPRPRCVASRPDDRRTEARQPGVRPPTRGWRSSEIRRAENVPADELKKLQDLGTKLVAGRRLARGFQSSATAKAKSIGSRADDFGHEIHKHEAEREVG